MRGLTGTSNAFIPLGANPRPMRARSCGRAPRLVPLVSALALASTATGVSASSAIWDPAADVLELSLLHLPLAGILLLLLYWLPTVWLEPPPQQGVARHVLLFLGSLLALVTIGAALNGLAHVERVLSTWSISLSNLAIVGLYMLLCMRYLGREVHSAVITGGALAAINLIGLAAVVEAGEPFMRDLLAYSRPLFGPMLVLMLVLLAAETYLVHIRRERLRGVARGEPPPPPMRIPLRLVAEVWGIAVAGAVLLAWTVTSLG